MGQGDTKNGVTQYPPSSNISISDLFKNVNRLDKKFLKYIPNGFLTEAQMVAKQEALQEDSDRISKIPKLNSEDTTKLHQLRDTRQQEQKDKVNKVLEAENCSRPAMQKNNIQSQGLDVVLVPKVGLEPTRCHQHRILSPTRLPFHHFGM